MLNLNYRLPRSTFEMIHIDLHENFLIFKTPTPTPLSIYIQTSSTSLTLDVQSPPSPASPNDNQAIERKHNPRMTFLFSINSLILCGFPLISFHLTEAPLSAFSWLYTLVCAAVNANKLWNNNRPVDVNEIKTKTKPSTSHSNIPRVLLFDLVHKQYSGIIEG